MAKEIYLMRHGKDDFRGALSDKGRTQIIESANKLKVDLRGITSVTVFYSPVERARDSAKILAEELKGFNVRLVVSEGLRCDSYNVVDVVDSVVDGTSILVTHQPDIEDYFERVAKINVPPFKNSEFRKLNL
jgi:phosphohistidine phosphatase SixA